MNNFSKILFIIYFICVIPTIIIYFIHGFQEAKESNKLHDMGNETKSIKTAAEGTFLISAAAGYIIFSLVMIFEPNSKIPYIAILVGTISIIIIFMARSEYGVPIPFTNLEIHKYTVGWEGMYSKIFQAILLIPISMLFVLNTTKGKIKCKKC